MTTPPMWPVWGAPQPPPQPYPAQRIRSVSRALGRVVVLVTLLTLVATIALSLVMRADHVSVWPLGILIEVLPAILAICAGVSVMRTPEKVTDGEIVVPDRARQRARAMLGWTIAQIVVVAITVPAGILGSFVSVGTGHLPLSLVTFLMLPLITFVVGAIGTAVGRGMLSYWWARVK